MENSTSINSPQESNVNKFIAYLVASVLFLAATTKAVYLISAGFSIEVLGYESRLVSWLVVLFEFFVGSWIFSGVYDRISRQVALGLFAIFTIVNAIQIIDGKSACNCFGDFSVSTKSTFVVDIICLICLIFWKPTASSKPKIAIGLMVAFSISICLAALSRGEDIKGVGLLLQNRFNSANQQKVVLLNTSPQIGEPLKLLSFCVGDTTKTHKGSWKIVLYTPDCAECEELIASILNEKQRNHMVAFVSTIFEQSLHSRVQSSTDCEIAWLALSQEYEWIARTPAVLYIDDGMVVK